VAKVSATSFFVLTSVISILLCIINVYLYSMRPEERGEERRKEPVPPSRRVYKMSGVQRGGYSIVGREEKEACRRIVQAGWRPASSSTEARVFSSSSAAKRLEVSG